MSKILYDKSSNSNLIVTGKLLKLKILTFIWMCTNSENTVKFYSLYKINYSHMFRILKFNKQNRKTLSLTSTSESIFFENK